MEPSAFHEEKCGEIPDTEGLTLGRGSYRRQARRGRALLRPDEDD